MPQTITTSATALVEAAEREIETVPVEQAIKLHGRDDTVLVDIRDVRELQRDGKVPGAFHCPRGMLEFWIDPASSYHKPQFAQDKRYVFFCAGGLRSALAAQTAQRMGLKPVAHIAGGFGAWKKAGGPVEAVEAKPQTMNEQGPIIAEPKRKRLSPELMLAAFSAVGLVGFVITFIFVMRAPPDSQAAPSPQATFAQRVTVSPGETGARGPAGPIGPRGPAGDAGIRIVRNDCGTATCSVECNEDEMVLTAYCGAARLPATFNSDREATCRLPATGRGRIDVVAACVTITKR